MEPGDVAFVISNDRRTIKGLRWICGLLATDSGAKDREKQILLEVSTLAAVRKTAGKERATVYLLQISVHILSFPSYSWPLF